LAEGIVFRRLCDRFRQSFISARQEIEQEQEDLEEDEINNNDGMEM